MNGYWAEGIQRCVDAGLVRMATIDDPGMREAVEACADRLAKHIDAEILRSVLADVLPRAER